MSVKNIKLTYRVGGRKSEDKPSMYKDSKLFHTGKDNKKALELPDPQEEAIEPKEFLPTETVKASQMLDSMVAKANMSSGQFINPSDAQAKREYDNSFTRQTQGVSGSSTPDLPERGRDWHGTVPGVPDEPQDEETQEDAENSVNNDKPTRYLEGIKSVNDKAIKALAGAPLFFDGPTMPPKEKLFLTENGFSPEEIRSGSVQMTPQLRGEFNMWLSGVVRKSIASLKV